MPNVWATKTGNWSDPTVWNTGTLPTASDAVWASGSTVTIDQNISVISINTTTTGSIGAGGNFSVTTSRTINANIIAGSTNCLSLTGTNTAVNIIGNVTGSSTGTGIAVTINTTSGSINLNGNILGIGFSNSHAVQILGISNTVNITGSVIGGSAGTNNNVGIDIQGITNKVVISGSLTGGSMGTGQGPAVSFGGTYNTLLVTGNLIGGSGGVNNTALNINSTTPFTVTIIGDLIATTAIASRFSNFATALMQNGILNITGSIRGASASGFVFSNLANNLTVNVSGSVVGGTVSAAHGIDLSTLNFNTVNINGNVTAGTTATSYGISNGSNSTVIVTGSALSTIAPAINNTSTGQVIVGTAIATTSSAAVNNTGATPVIYEAMTIATNGRLPITGPARLRLNDNNFISCSLDTGGYKTLINANNIANGQPAASDVRRGIAYNFGDTTGSMAVPSASYVDSGVAVGNTVGTAVYTTASLATTVWNTNVAALTGSNSVGERLRNISTVDSIGDQLVALL